VILNYSTRLPPFFSSSDEQKYSSPESIFPLDIAEEEEEDFSFELDEDNATYGREHDELLLLLDTSVNFCP